MMSSNQSLSPPLGIRPSRFGITLLCPSCTPS
jgi:hypothetical protein